MVVLVLGAAVGLLGVYTAFAHTMLEGLVALAILAGTFGIVGLVSWPRTYTLADTHLLVRAGLIRMRIPYADITGIEPSSSPLSAPALSLRRVKIRFAGRFQLVSPEPRDAFIGELKERVRGAGRPGVGSDAR